MKLCLIAALLLSISLPAVLSLKCLVCSSTKSWDECKTSSTTCVAPAADKCFKFHFKGGGVETFSKGCAPNAFCDKDTNPTCKAASGSFECEISCCTGDDCNAGSATRISSILLLTCALASLMILFKA